MSAETTYTPYRYTPQGMAEEWTRRVAGIPQPYDFQGAIERQGVQTAKRIKREETEVME